MRLARPLITEAQHSVWEADLVITLIDAGKCKGDVLKLEIPVLPEEDNPKHARSQEGGAAPQAAAAAAEPGGASKRRPSQPQILVVNKSDLVGKQKAGYAEHILMESLKPGSGVPMFDRSFFISAMTGKGVGRSKSLLATNNLLENTDGVLRAPLPSPPWEYPISVLSGGTLLPSIYADARYIDAVIVSQAL